MDLERDAAHLCKPEKAVIVIDDNRPVEVKYVLDVESN
jgi:hypothetical protein